MSLAAVSSGKQTGGAFPAKTPPEMAPDTAIDTAI